MDVNETKGHPKVFISYVREDGEKALRLYDYLKSVGCEPWIDSKNLVAGENWKNTINENVGKSDFFMACLSSNSISKVGFFQAELYEAYEILKQFPEGKIYFIPVRFDDCDIPFEIRKYHWVNLFESDGMENLFNSLKIAWERRGFIWPENVDTDVAAILTDEFERGPFENVISFVKNIVYLRDNKSLDELREIYQQGLKHFQEDSDKGIIHYVWSATLRQFAKKQKDAFFLEEAKDVAFESTKLAPDNPDSWLECAQVHRDIGEISAARQYYENCLEVDPDKDECLTSYAMLLQRHCTPKDKAGNEKIIELLERLLEIRPNDIMSHDVLGTKYLFERRDFAKAEEHFSFIKDKIERSPFGRKQKAIMLFHQGQYFEETGDLKNALNFYEKSFSLVQHPSCGRRISAVKRRLTE